MTTADAMSADRASTRLATRLAFLVAGFGLACWAPLVPFAKDRLAVDDGILGALLLCIGVGSIGTMVLAGLVIARFGSKPVIVASAVGLALVLPFLALAGTPLTLGLALLVFGASLGALDVAMNVHAVEVERAAQRPLMSGFHALFSIGGFAGSTVMTFLLSMRLGTLPSALLCSLLMAGAIVLTSPRLLQTRQVGDGPLFVLPHGIVLVLAAMAAITFLVEGALLDWSALLVTGAGLVSPAHGGLGYMLFAIAMTAGRLSGDRLTARLGDRAALFWGGVVAVAGFIVLLGSPVPALAMAAFVPIGLGASNIVPILFRQAGAQSTMPPGLAVAAITTIGYAGILAGPAGIGFLARAASLPAAFWMLALLLCVIPVFALTMVRKK